MSSGTMSTILMLYTGPFGQRRPYKCSIHVLLDNADHIIVLFIENNQSVFVKH